MNITPELVVALSAFVAALVAGLGTFLTSRQGARKDEVILLREEVARLQSRVQELEGKVRQSDMEREKLQNEIHKLRLENSWLRSVLMKSGIEVPRMPESWRRVNED